VARGHDYVTLVCDLTEGTVEYLVDERKQTSLDVYFTALTPAQRGQIQAVAMDMWGRYVQSVRSHVPQAEQKIVLDVFHIMQHMNGAVDQVRRHEHRLLRARGDETLKGSKDVWLYGEENVPEHQRARFAELTRRRARKQLQTARARGDSRRACAICGDAVRGWRRRSSGNGGTAGRPAPGSRRS
jgi:transposase